MKHIASRLPDIGSVEVGPAGYQIWKSIPGLGPKRRRELLTHFGGQQAIIKASEEAIGKVDGISKKLAEIIYAELHNID